MGSTVFSTKLQQLRKEKKVTQEELASHLGVSPQAVSKWENGSYPEGDLLPAIADFFSVSIDYLYGRVERDRTIEQQLFYKYQDYFQKKQEKGETTEDNAEFWESRYSCIWAAQISPWLSNRNYYERNVSEDENIRVASVQFDNIGYSYMNLNKGNEFYLMLKNRELDGGFARYLKNNENTRTLFKYLSSEENVRILSYMYTLGYGQYAGADTIAEAVKVDKKKVEELLDFLHIVANNANGNQAINKVSIVNKQGNTELAYGVDMNMAGLLFGLFAVADSYVNPPHGYNMQISGRTKPWLDRQKDL